MKKLALLLFVAALDLLAASCLHAQALLNGGFENPTLADGTLAFGSGDDWTATGTAAVLTNGYGFGTTPYGNQWVDLVVGTTDTQTVNGPFVLGATYTLSLAAADVGGNAGDRLTLTISGGAVANQSFDVPINGNSLHALPFITYTLAFTPTSNAPVIFTLANTSTDNGALALDNVLIVPEPTTWALLASGGVSLLGFTLRRRRSRRV